MERARDFDRDLTSAEFDGMVSNLLKKIAVLVQYTMREVGVNNADLNRVLLTGGSAGPCQGGMLYIIIEDSNSARDFSISLFRFINQRAVEKRY